MKLIELGKGKKVAVDERDYEWLRRYRWVARKRHRDWYAERKGKKGKRVSMAREIMGFPEGKIVDHKSGVTLDNRRKNLRIATQANNQHNQRRLRVDNTSGYKGVTFFKPHEKWNAQIYVNMKRVSLGYFKTKEAAARAYDAAAVRYFGEFAAPNTVLL